MVLNLGKFYFICIGKDRESETFFYNNTEMKTSNKEGAPGCLQELSPVTLEAEFWNGVSSITVGGNGASIGGWIA